MNSGRSLIGYPKNQEDGMMAEGGLGKATAPS
jgi:hypothetical protein